MRDSTSRPRENINLAELLRSEPMRAVQMHALASLDRDVDQIRLVDDVEQVRTARPGTVVILHRGIAQTAWSTAIAVRYAWERNVRAVICQLDAPAATTVISLAERLSVPLGIYEGDLAALALELAAIVASPEATRARLIAGCAELIAQQDEVAAILGVVEAELPGVRLVLHTPPPGAVKAAQSDSGATIRVPLGRLDLHRGRELLATVERASVDWIRTVTTVLEIARAQIIACESPGQVLFAQRRQLEGWTLKRLVDHSLPAVHASWQDDEPRLDESVSVLVSYADTDAAAAAARLGWRTGPFVVAGCILPRHAEIPMDDELDLALAAAWPQGATISGPVRYGAGWAVWLTFETDSVQPGGPDDDQAGRQATRDLLTELRRCIGAVAIGVPIAAGVGTPTSGGAGLGISLRHAELAAKVARNEPEGGVLTFRQLGASAFLAAADAPALRELASETLARLGGIEDRAALAGTLAAYLDCGGSTGRAAELLGVHRNTVSSRVDRVRRLGVDLDDPATRLGLHMAAHFLAR